MTPTEILNLIFIIIVMIFVFAASCGIVYFFKIYLPENKRQNELKKIAEKHQRIIEGDNLLQEYEIGREWGNDNYLK